MIDCRLCTNDEHTGNHGEIVGKARCRIHDKTATRCHYYCESDDAKEYYKQHPLRDLP